MEPAPVPLVLFGATGAVGGRLLARLRRQARPVLAVSRAARGEDDVRWLRGDLYAGDDALAAAVRAALPPAPAPWLLSAGPLDGFAAWAVRAGLPAGARVVALSSMSADTKLDSHDPQERALAARLRGAEAALLDAAAAQGWSATLLRPTLIWGTGLDRSLSPLVALGARVRLLPLPRGSVGLRQPVHADDLAQAMLAAAARPELGGEVLPLPGGETLGFDAMLERSLAVHAPHARVLRVPDAPVLRLLPVLARAGGRLRAIDNALRRSRVDLVAPGDAWARLGIAPRPFRPGPEAFRAAGG
ncbi:hypothetical protein [Coralloluteibacterium stylophorae]|uniref:NAD-dependent epimerase/dehydratase family protein n=2 Tax=Coralloluteibacterium stylophorae TaxID=1776034 RepID=A0AAP2CCG8_9GAMM|nr:hypothetical protein [Coralloluteibacterium stylophorae]MBS7457880.1 hypothetical protein [Coralloluteibacterium stylophorae]